MYGKSNMETFITMCKIDSQWKFPELYGSGNSNRGSVSTQRGGMGREMGGKFKREGIYVSVSSVQSLRHVRLFVTP